MIIIYKNINKLLYIPIDKLYFIELKYFNSSQLLFYI
jgi:hypothetical protein